MYKQDSRSEKKEEDMNVLLAILDEMDGEQEKEARALAGKYSLKLVLCQKDSPEAKAVLFAASKKSLIRKPNDFPRFVAVGSDGVPVRSTTSQGRGRTNWLACAIIELNEFEKELPAPNAMSGVGGGRTEAEREGGADGA